VVYFDNGLFGHARSQIPLGSDRSEVESDVFLPGVA